MNLLIAVVVMVVGYGIAIIAIFRVLAVASSFKRDVPFVPSSSRYVKEALKILEPTKGDHIADLGSGDGKFLISAARLFPEVQFTGIEISKLLVFWSNWRARLLRIKNLKFECADLLSADLSRFNKIYLYMTTGFNEILMPLIKQQSAKGTVVAAAHFGLGQKFEAQESDRIQSVDINKGRSHDKITVWTNL